MSEEAATNGGQVGAGFPQESSHNLERRRVVMARFIVEMQFPELDNLRAATVALPKIKKKE